MNSNPFSRPSVEIKVRKNPLGEYVHLTTDQLLRAIKQSAHSTHRKDLDTLLEIFLKRYNARQTELDELNKSLERRIREEVAFKNTNRKLYEQQAKMAAMGEMMDAIAHQWRQPLNAISMMSDMLQTDFQNNLVNQAYIDELTDDTQLQIAYGKYFK